MSFLPILTEPDEIRKLEDAEGVEDEEHDEPSPLVIARRVPEGESLEDEGPKRCERENDPEGCDAQAEFGAQVLEAGEKEGIHMWQRIARAKAGEVL